VEKVTGIGGVFFRARDPIALAFWYREYLGIDLVPEDYEQPGWRQQAGPTAFAPFPENTDCFGDRNRLWMINFRVSNLDAMVEQLRDAGIRWRWIRVIPIQMAASPALMTPKATPSNSGNPRGATRNLPE